MTDTTKAKTNWQKIDAKTLPATMKAKLDTLHKAFEQVKKVKAEFSDDLIALYVKSQGAPPEGHELIVSHMYGLAVAVVPVKERKGGNNALTL